MRQVLALFLVVILLANCDVESAKGYLLEAEELSMQEDYDGAILLLDKAIEKNSGYLGAYINRGADKSALGDYAGAIADYEKVLELDPENTLALVNTGNNYKRLAKYEEAIPYYDRALNSKGGPGLYLNLVDNSFIEGDLYNVTVNEIIFERAIAYFYAGKLQKSFEDLETLLHQNFMAADCHYWIGHIYLSSDKIDLACKSFRHSAQLGDKDAEQERKIYCQE